MLNPEEKAMTLVYTHCKLLKMNLDIVIHERKVKGKPYKDLLKRLEKLRSAEHDAFREINMHLKQQDKNDDMTKELERIMGESWADYQTRAVCPSTL